jgi:3-oxoacyl-[acyl-carrier-protein] synthase II
VADEVVITGLGIASPIGCTEARFWDSLCAGRSGVAPVDCVDTTKLPRHVGCQIHDSVGPHRPMGRAAQLATLAARQAVAAAGLNPPDADPARMAVTVGTTMGETDFIEQRLEATDDEWLTTEHMRQIAGARPGTIARHVQADLGASGSAVDLYGACAAGNMAMAMAARSLLDGRCDVAVAGGADGFSRLAFLGFMRLRIMAAEVCRPFDRNRDGLLVGEGAGMFVLERESQARARGAVIRARLLGWANACENYHPTRPDPDGDGLTRATRLALQVAGIRPEEVDYVCAHGTGTPQNDAIEVKVMQQCFPAGLPFSSIKALIGHTMGAAAATEAACCVLSLEHQVLIPTWHLEDPIETGSLHPLQAKVKPARVRCVVNNSAGFGGYNSSIILAAA